jgi:Tfp pilus assembly protein FimT
MAGRRLQRGFTLTDTVVSLAIVAVLILATSGFLASHQKAFNSAYAGAFSSAVDGARIARTIFQKTIRQACSTVGAASVDPDGNWLEVRYYSSSGVSSPDRLARFELSGQDLVLRKSLLETGETLSVETVCGSVASAKFNLVGASAQMFLTLEDGTSSQVVSTCATMRSP